MKPNKQDFSKWKFEWLDALMTGVQGRELAVALYLLQRCNAESGRLNPSMGNVAHMLSCSVKTVERAIDRLSSMGVLTSLRHSRHDSYQYRFQDEWKVETLEVRRRLQAEWDGKRYERLHTMVGPDNSVWSGGQSDMQDHTPDQTDLTGPDPTDVSG